MYFEKYENPRFEQRFPLYPSSRFTRLFNNSRANTREKDHVAKLKSDGDMLTHTNRNPL